MRGGKNNQTEVKCKNTKVRGIEIARGNLASEGKVLLTKASRAVASPWRRKNAVACPGAGDLEMKKKINSWNKPETRKVSKIAIARDLEEGLVFTSAVTIFVSLFESLSLE